MALKLRKKLYSMLERNYKPIERDGLWLVEYESYIHITGAWSKHFFKDFLGDILIFYKKDHCINWINVRCALINTA
jgi:hypothetical protein